MSLKHAILAMLDIESGSGYDLVKRFNKSVGYFWSSPYQQVYRDLQALESQNLISGEAIEQTGKPDKKIFTITAAGTSALEDWIRKPAKGMKIKDPLLVKVFAGHRLTKQELSDEIAVHEQTHIEKLNLYLKLAEDLDALDEPLRQRYLLPTQTLKLGIKIENAWLEWAQELKEDMDQLPFSADQNS